MTEKTNITRSETSPIGEKLPSKKLLVERLLKRPRGATIAEMSTATGWQNHTVRAHLTGVRKARQLAKEARKSGETSYRLLKTALPAQSEQV